MRTTENWGLFFHLTIRFLWKNWPKVFIPTNIWSNPSLTNKRSTMRTNTIRNICNNNKVTKWGRPKYRWQPNFKFWLSSDYQLSDRILLWTIFQIPKCNRGRYRISERSRGLVARVAFWNWNLKYFPKLGSVLFNPFCLITRGTFTFHIMTWIGLGPRDALFSTLNIKIAHYFGRECAIFASIGLYLVST